MWTAPAEEKSPSSAKYGPLRTRTERDQLGDQEVDVGIALAVAVGAHVDRHAVDRDGEVGAVVEVEAAQEILVGFALAAVLRDDEAGHRFSSASPGRVTGYSLTSAPETTRSLEVLIALVWLGCAATLVGAGLRLRARAARLAAGLDPRRGPTTVIRGSCVLCDCGVLDAWSVFAPGRASCASTGLTWLRRSQPQSAISQSDTRRPRPVTKF